MELDNPYQSPQYEFEPVERYSDGSLTWILFSFQGRIPRRVYWAAWLGTIAVFLAIMALFFALFGTQSNAHNIAMMILFVPMIWISWAVHVKRWHDRNKSGWWMLINFIPYIGKLWVLIELGCLRGTDGPNEYGVDPT